MVETFEEARIYVIIYKHEYSFAFQQLRRQLLSLALNFMSIFSLLKNYSFLAEKGNFFFFTSSSLKGEVLFVMLFDA